jgi:hypothetical protein
MRMHTPCTLVRCSWLVVLHVSSARVHAATPRVMMPMMMGGPLPMSMFQLPLLVSKLGGSDGVEDQRSALVVISHLSFWGSADRVAAVTSAGAIPPLVQLLGIDYPPEFQEEAAQALWGLSRADAENAATIAAAGAISPLVQLLGRGFPAGVVRNALGALAHLSSYHDISVIISAAGAVPQLVQLLRSDLPADVIHNAVTAMAHLSQHGDGAAAFAAAGALSFLLLRRAKATLLRMRWFLLAVILAGLYYVKVVYG